MTATVTRFPGGLRTLAFHVIPELKLRKPSVVAEMLTRFQEHFEVNMYEIGLIVVLVDVM